MKGNKWTGILGLLLLLSHVSLAQIEKVLVETYYVADSLDATDSIDGVLEVGAKTYRIYIDMVAGLRLHKIYGDANHALQFSSTAPFFNNVTDGQTFANDISKSRLGENTVALDTWLTLGVTTKSVSKVFGIPKHADSDGSFIGGTNNDLGLLMNTDPLAGIPITSSDGNQSVAVAASGWASGGFDLANDSTIFGSLVPGTLFSCTNCGLQNDGVEGADPDSNYVLVAQLTTKGEIEFELNVEILDGAGQIIKYVANDSVLLPGEVWERKLKYTFEPVCGCPDSTYIEYLADRDCNNPDSCKHLVVFGCMDTSACNYSANATVNIPSLCCYPGKCSDRDLAFVCPQLVESRKGKPEFKVYPNPTSHMLYIKAAAKDLVTQYSVYNLMGKMVLKSIVENPASILAIDLSILDKGMYMLRVYNGEDHSGQLFIKE